MGGSAATSTSAPTARQCSALRGSPAATSRVRGFVLRPEGTNSASSGSAPRPTHPGLGALPKRGDDSATSSAAQPRQRHAHDIHDGIDEQSRTWMKLTRRAIISSARARRRAWSWAGWLAARRACRSPATAAAAPRASRRTASSIWPADDSPLSAARFCSLKQKTRGQIQRHRDNNEMSSGCRS